MPFEVTYFAPSWRQIYSMLLNQSLRIRRSGFCPDLIVGVARGGWIPARVLSDLLEKVNLANARAESYTGIAKGGKLLLTQRVSVDVAGKQVLVVDEVVDSGKSAQLIAEHIIALGAREVKTAALFRKSGCHYNPDFYETETDAWVVFPWEIKETLRHILNTHKSTQSLEKEMSKLAEAGISRQLLKRLFAELQETKSC